MNPIPPRDSEAIRRTIATNVSAARRAKHLTQVRLAEVSGVTLATIRDVERARYNTTLLTVLRLSEALGKPLDALVRP
jgi:transcriptional regulator with XRE-family HTH domain